MMVVRKGNPFNFHSEVSTMNNCLCNLFDDNWVWIIIIALLLIFCCGGC